jgi:hypothetical protein
VVVFLYKYIYMKSFKQYLDIQEVEAMTDFEDQSFSSKYNASMADKDKWPPFPQAKHDAQKRKWRVSKDGRYPEHLAKAQ